MGEIVLDCQEIGVIEHVVELKPELEIQPLGYVCVLIKGQVSFDKGWITELTGLLVAVCARNRYSELPSAENPGVRVGVSRRSLLIASDIWITEVVSIGEVITCAGCMCICTDNIGRAVVSR